MFEICFLGGGKMASAILDGALSAGVVELDAVHVVERLEESRISLSTRFTGVSVSDDLEPAKLYVLATKPQDVSNIAKSARALVDGDSVSWNEPPILVSIAAGITRVRLESLFGDGFRIVRTMPNTAVAVKSGVVAICDDPDVDRPALDRVEELFSGVAHMVRVPEAKVDAVTAISGSGPAYFMYLIEAMEEAGVTIGLTADMARELAIYTMAGSAKLAATSSSTPRQLRLDVTSPGGTTAQAIRVFDRGGLRSTIMEAVIACYERAKELDSK